MSNHSQPTKRKRTTDSTMPRDAPAQNKAYKAPGRLGDPKMELFQDPRVNKKLLETLSKYGMERNLPPPSLQTLGVDPSTEDLGRSMAQAEAGFERMHEALENELPQDAIELPVKQELETISAPGNHQMKLHIFRPQMKGGPLPCIVYFHQGGMTVLKTVNRVNRRWLTSLAAQGMVAIAVDFRNAWTPSGFNPFPIGLNDCCAAVKWVHSRKDDLNIRNIVLQGNSGGANLALSVALKAKREGWSVQIDGVYACSPYISNAYSWSLERQLSELPSLVECQGYFYNVNYGAYIAHVYTPNFADRTNPLAWPYHATVEELEGLPPHVLTLDELDPLRDEGIAYYRKLSAAGVRVEGSVNIGLTHCADLIFRRAVPEHNRSAIRKIAAFAKCA